MGHLAITSMSEAHIDSLLAIEKSSFKHPWGKLSFMSELSNEDSYNFVLHMPGAPKDGIVAYLCMRQIIDEIHLLKIAVKKGFRRKGIAYHFLKKCLSTVDEEQIKAIILDVRPSNIAGLRLYQKIGFHIIGQRPKYYTDTGEDGIIMEKTLS